MALQKLDTPFRILGSDELEAWRAIPPAVASDCMNRTQVMSAKIKPISPGLTLCGQARTVTTMVGDCGPICVQIDQARPGEIIVVDAAGAAEIAVWGGVMAEAAIHRAIGGAVVDGAIRDIADMRKAGLKMFCAAATPRGPHQGFGGVVDGRASVGGVPVDPGDIVLGDDDGIVVVPLAHADAVLVACQQHVLTEKSWVDGIRRGQTLAEINEAHF